MSGQTFRIVFVLNNFLPNVGGVEYHVAALAQNLTKAGNEVLVLVLGDDQSLVSPTDIKVLRFPSTRKIGGVLAFPTVRSVFRIHRELKCYRPDVISVHTRFFPMTWLGVALGQRENVPVILTEHGSGHVRGVSPLVAFASRLIDVTAGRWSLQKSAKILAISPGAASFVTKLSSVEPSIFLNAIDVGAFRLRQRDGGGLRLVFVGRMVPGKGWEVALDVFESVAEEFPESKLHYVGDGPDLIELRAKVELSSFQDRIHVHGRLEPSDLPSILQNSVLMNPTRLAEGFQTTLLEVLAAGGKVVTSPVSAAHYLVSLQHDVTIVRENRLSAWVNATRSALNRAGARSSNPDISEFDWSHRAQEYFEIIDEVAQVGLDE